MGKESEGFFTRLIDALIPREIKPYGSTIVDDVYPDQDRYSGKEMVVLRVNAVKYRNEPELPFIAEAGKYRVGQRVQLIEVRVKGPVEALLVRRDDVSYSELHVRPYNELDEKIDPKNIGDFVCVFDHLP